MKLLKPHKFKEFDAPENLYYGSCHTTIKVGQHPSSHVRVWVWSLSHTLDMGHWTLDSVIHRILTDS